MADILALHQVRFCSTSCRDYAWSTYHPTECGLTHFLDRSGVGTMGLLALRTVVLVGLHALTEVVASDGKTDPCLNQVYDSTDYLNIYQLITNTSQRSVADLFRRTVMAVYLASILRHRDFFHGDDAAHPSTVAVALLRHLQNYPCNAHEISQLCVPIDASSYSVSDESQPLDPLDMKLSDRSTIAATVSNVGRARVCQVGAAAYACLSLINHSCDPNVTRNCVGDTTFVTTVRPIAAGQEILDNYGYHYAMQNYSDRQSHLTGQYYFRCCCVACVQQWPLYSDLNEQLQVSPCPESIATRCQRRTELQASSKDFITWLNVFMDMPACHRSNAGCKWVEIARPFIRHIQVLDTHVIRPTRQ